MKRIQKKIIKETCNRRIESIIKKKKTTIVISIKSQITTTINPFLPHHGLNLELPKKKKQKT
jgi:hypothetical protein